MAISVSLNGENFEQVIYTKEDAFEQLVAQNAQTIFGDKAIYIDAKKKVNTSSLGGTIPDGFLIDLSDPDDPQFYLVEVELQNHDFFNHIFPQITKFFAFYRDSKQRHKLIETMFAFFNDDPVLTKKLRDLIGPKEIHKFFTDTIDSNQNILIIIDDLKPEFKDEFKEIINAFTAAWEKMVKVQTIKHFRQGESNILIVDTPVAKLPFGGAISTTSSPRLGLIQKAIKMLQDGKTKTETKKWLIKKYIKLGKDGKKAERNANSTMWNAKQTLKIMSDIFKKTV